MLYNIDGVKDALVNMVVSMPVEIAIIHVCAHVLMSSIQPHVVYIIDSLQNHKWEDAMTIDKASWGFRREATLKDILTIEQLLETFVSTVR